MKHFKYILMGIVFGILLSKAEVLSWYRWQETFLLKGFQIVGVMICAVITGATGLYLIKKTKMKDIDNLEIIIPAKKISFYRYALGGLIFGLGWAMSGCPGATYALIGYGYVSIIIGLISAIAGTFFYELIKKRLPH